MSGAARRYRVIEIHDRACAIGAVDPQLSEPGDAFDRIHRKLRARNRAPLWCACSTIGRKPERCPMDRRVVCNPAGADDMDAVIRPSARYLVVVLGLVMPLRLPSFSFGTSDVRLADVFRILEQGLDFLLYNASVFR